MKRCICHHWIPPTECYVLGAPRIRWGGVREALGGPGGPWGVGSCKVYAPVNPHTKYMRIYGSSGKGEKNDKMTKNIRCNGVIDGLLMVL